MSLKYIGKFSSTANQFKGLTSKLDVIRKFHGLDDFYRLSKSLSGLEIDEAAKRLNSLKLNPKLSSEILTEANNLHLLKGSSDEIAAGIQQVASSSGSIGGVGTAFKGLFASIQPLLPLIGAVAAGFALFKGFQFLDDKFTLTFGTAQKHLEESSAAYNNTVSEIQSINSELETTRSRIEELQSKDKLTLTEQAELANLERQNTLLENQLRIKQSLAESQGKEAAEDARETINFASEEVFVKDDNGNYVTQRDDQLAKKSVNRKDYVKEQLKLMEEAQAQIDEAQEKLNDKKLSKEDKETYSKQFEQAGKNPETYKQEADRVLAELNTESENFYNKETGTVISGFEEDAQAVMDLNTQRNIFDLPETEKQLKLIESLFSGSSQSSTIKDQILSLLEAGEINKATDALKSLGITLTDLGITGNGSKTVFNNYFQELVDSAKAADEALNSVDGSFKGVAQASDSANQGAEFDSMKGYLAKADELYKQGLIGTDDFQTAAQFIAPKKIDTTGYEREADAYAAAWENAYTKVKNWFSDEEGSGIHSFSKDLAVNGLADVVDDGENWNIDLKFNNTAEAAAKLGTSVEAVELAMAKLEEYGFEFDDVQKSSEQLYTYKSTLDNIKALHDEMNEGGR